MSTSIGRRLVRAAGGLLLAAALLVVPVHPASAINRALDLNACGLADGTNIQQWAWLNNNCQRFRLLPV
jgi:hypothetical protein